MNLIWSDALSVGVEGMDAHHRAFIEAWAGANSAAEGDAFAQAFQALMDHLGEHFAYEEGLMAQTGFPALGEHRGEHSRVLAEMREMAGSLARGRPRMARLYVKERLPEWFLLHRDTMDMATAVYLKGKETA
jgi:hemerythrin